jgi:hypothetical protein
VRTNFGGVRAQGLVGFEVLVALDGKAERTSKVTKFVHADESELLGPSWPSPYGPACGGSKRLCRLGRGQPSPKSQKPKAMSPELGEEPGALRVGRE